MASSQPPKGTGPTYVIAENAEGRRGREYLGPYFEPDGRTVNVGTIERAAKWLQERRILGPQAPRRPDAPLTVAELADRFLTHAGFYSARP